MLTFIVVILYVLVILLDFLPVLRAGQKKECWVYSVFLAVSFCVLLLYSLDVKVPSPSVPIKNLVEKIFKL